MEIRTDVKVLDVYGKEIVEPNPAGGEPQFVPVTLGKLLVGVLTGNAPDTDDTKDGGKFKRFLLAQRIQNAGGQVDLSAEDVTLCKRLFDKAYTPALVGPVWLLLEGKG